MNNMIVNKMNLMVSTTVLIFLLIFEGAVLAVNHWDPRTFVMEGTLYRQGDPKGSIGYDGQFAYYIALDPIRARDQMDHPAYRYQRILYPLVSWLFSLGGNPSLLPWVMVLINLVASVLTVGLLAILFEKLGVSAWFAIAYILFAGVLISLRADLNEPLAIALALLGLWLFFQKRWIWSGLFLGLAVLAKEIAITFVLGLIAWSILNKRFRIAIILTVSGLMPSIIWGLILTYWLGMSPLSAKFAALERIPFYGLVLLDESPAKVIIMLWVALPMLVLSLIGILNIKKFSSSPLYFIMFANIGLLSLMPRLAWINVAGAMRAVIGLMLMSLLYTAEEKPHLLPWIGAYWVTSGLLFLPNLISDSLN